MFTGIIEKMGIVHDVIEQGTNKTFWITSDLASELKIDQSVAHNGACLTVVEKTETRYAVTAIMKHLKKPI